jgi:starch synthase
LIGLSGAALLTGALVKRRGGKFICDRGSTHHSYQAKIVSDEFRRWGLTAPPTDPRDTAREETIYEVADAVTVPSSFSRRSFIELGVPTDKIHIIQYGVRLENFAKALDPPKDAFHVLFAGSVSLRKGVPYLLQAFQQVKHGAKRLRCAGTISQEIRQILDRLPQQDVEFLGAVPQAHLPRLMSESHLLVLPSVEEGLALVQGQALACGCPVLASTNTGAEDLFTDGVEGYIVPIRDVGALSDRMQRIADDPQLQRRMSDSALARVKQLGGWRHYGDAWERLLLGLTQR